MKDEKGFTIITLEEMEKMMYDEDYAEYIMANASGDARAICNGDQLTIAMEDLYLFEDYLMSKNLVCPEL